ncbi:response regulator [Methylobacterium sp. 77]|uniref:response regulator n=1 Tax=Methylobacterium sp. 77 TaxID=1101192 RepID=UPI0003641934|nr:response regulator [Methylobacterium sp. 77]
MKTLSLSLMSLKSLSAAVAGTSALVVLVCGSLTNLSLSRNDARRPLDTTQASQRFAAAVDRGVYDVVQDLKTLSIALKQTSRGLDADELQTIVSAWLGSRPDYSELNLVAANGRVKVAGNDLGFGRDVSGRSWFLRAKASRSIVAVPSAGADGQTVFDIALPVPGSAFGSEDVLVARLNEAWLGDIRDRVLGTSPVANGATGLAVLGPDARSGSGLLAQHSAGGREFVEQVTPSAGYRDLAPSGWLAVARSPNSGLSRNIEAFLPDGRTTATWLAVCILAACAGWIFAGRFVRRLKLIGDKEPGLSAPSRIAELQDHAERLAARERSGVRALQETRSALSRSRERFRTFEAMSGWTYWDIDMEAGSVTWTDPATRSTNAVSDRAVALTDLTDGIAPEDRDLMAFTMQAALDEAGPHDVVLRTTGTLAQDGQRRLFVRFIRAEGDNSAGKPAMLHALSREFAGEAGRDEAGHGNGLDADVVGASGIDGGASPIEPRRRESDAAGEARSGTVLRKVVDGVIHDFNNVLTVVIASLGTLQRRHEIRPDQMRLVDAALAGAQRGSSLTRRLVNFVRRDDTGLQETDVAVTLAAFVPFLGANVLHQTSVETRIRPGLAKVLCSEKVLEAVLLNLAFHVRDIGSEGFAIGADEKTLSAGEGIALAPGRYVRIVLASGTPARHAAVMPSGDSEATKAVAALLMQVGGGFRLLADGSGGTGFLAELWLPAGEAASRSAASEGGAPTLPLRVLLVDSDSLVRQSFADALADLGHAVIQAGSAEHALALLDEAANYDAMITDWAMPVVSGLQLAATMTQRHPHIRVVLASPGGQMPVSARAFLHIEKPFRYPDLAAIMREAGRKDTAEAA